MNTAPLIKPPPPPSAEYRPSARLTSRSPDYELPTLGERLGAVLPLIFVVPVAGPPAILLVGPLVLFALMLTGPFLLLVTFVLAAVILLTPIAAILVPAYLLVRHLGRHSAGHADRYPPTHRLIERHQPVGVGLRLTRDRVTKEAHFDGAGADLTA